MYEQEQYGEDESGWGLEAALVLVGFAWRSIRRHMKLVVACLLGVCVLAGGLFTVMPRTYQVETRILTHPSYIIPSITRQRQSLQNQTLEATRGAGELIKSRSSLAKIAQDADLLARWKPNRSRMGKLVDAIRGFISDPISDAQLNEALVDLLEKKLWAFVNNDVIVITSNWHTPEGARLIAAAAQKQFLAQRRNRELAEVKETISILEAGLEAAKPSLEAAAKRLDQVASRKKISRPKVRAVSSEASSSRLRGVGEDLEGKRTEIERLERAYRSRMQAAQSKLNQLTASLGPQHPDVLRAIRELEAQSRPPEELASLRAGEARLALEKRSIEGQRSAASRAADIARSVADSNQPADSELERAMADFRQVDRNYNDLNQKLEHARMDLSTTEVALQYRYIVTVPPLLPRKPVKPKAIKIFAGAIIAGLFLGFMFAILVDIRSSRVLEPWQVERMLQIPVLGEIDEPR